jgi:hypothetical protein
MSNFLQWRAYIGPRFEPQSAATAWDWTRTTDYSLTSAFGRLATALDVGAASMVLQTSGLGSVLAPKGGLWVGPNGDGEGWEYVGYGVNGGSVFSDLVREPSDVREHSGVHSVNAEVRLWQSITTDDGRLHIIEECDENLCTVFWRAELSGVRAPRAFLRNGHAVLVRARTAASGDFENYLLGWIDGFQVEDDYQRLAKWKISVVSLHGMLQKTQQGTLVAGDRNIAKHGRIVAQDHPLAFPHKEFGSGDQLSPESDTSAKSAIDDNISTCWIADRVVGSDQDWNFDGWEPHNLFTRIFLRPPAGLGPGYRFLEITAGPNKFEPTHNARLITRNGHAGEIDLKSINYYGEHVIICENLNKFLTLEPCQDPSKIVEVGSALFDFIDPVQDCIAMYDTGLWGGDGWTTGAVAWGPPDYLDAEAAWSGQHQDWPGGGVPVRSPGIGECIKFQHNTEATTLADHFVVDWLSLGGYDYARGRDRAPFFPFFLLQLPGFNLSLDVDLTDAYTGVLKPWNGSDYSSNGLPASGTLQMAGEQMSFAKLDHESIQITARGQNGTDAQAHLAGEMLYVVDGTYATDAFLVNQIAWTASPGSGIYPRDFQVWGTASTVRPRIPLEDDDENPMSDFQQDYVSLAVVEGWEGGDWAATLTPARRLNWVLFACSLMNVDPARVRLGEFRVMADGSTHDIATWLQGTVLIADIFDQVLENAGLPDTAWTVVEPLISIDAFETATEAKDAWSVLRDLADYVGAMISIDFLSRITIRDNDFWLSDFATPVYSWERENVAGMQFVTEADGAVSQVRLKWLQSNGEYGGTVVHPATAEGLGRVEALKDAMYASETYAQIAARRRYMAARYPQSLVVKPVLADSGIHAGQFHLATWSFDDTSAQRTGFTMSVDTLIEKNVRQQAVRMVQVREAGF